MKRELAWIVEEYRVPSVTTDKAVEDLNKIVGFLEQEPTHAQAIAFNLAAHMTNVKEQLTNTIRGIERKKRTAASHVVLFNK